MFHNYEPARSSLNKSFSTDGRRPLIMRYMSIMLLFLFQNVILYPFSVLFPSFKMFFFDKGDRDYWCTRYNQDVNSIVDNVSLIYTAVKV